MTLDRRTFLHLGGASFVPWLIPGVELWAMNEDSSDKSAIGARLQDRILILVELQGGNDGLNTVVPFRNERYKQLRPKIGLKPKNIIELESHLGINSALAPLTEAWEDGDACWILGLGYPKPNRSHFRSIEIWETGSDSDEEIADGWLARMLKDHSDPHRAADGIVIGGGDTGPLFGNDLRVLNMDDPEDFSKQARTVPEVAQGKDARKALEHLIEVQKDINKAAGIIDDKIKSGPNHGVRFPDTRFGRRCSVAADLVASGVPCPVIKLSIGGFDTHSDQLNKHSRLLAELSGGLSALRQALKATGIWERSLISTYSEFGRRARENGSQGTDHGTAAPHLVMGGAVQGGFAGRYPDLGKLDKDDLIHTTDYRRLYATIEQKWFELPPREDVARGAKPLEILKTVAKSPNSTSGK